jgi:hypothetical protein
MVPDGRRRCRQRKEKKGTLSKAKNAVIKGVEINWKEVAPHNKNLPRDKK